MLLQSSYLIVLLFFSGAAGLGYEIVWTRMLATVLGHEIIAVLAVVAAFFSGLALGSWVLDRPVSCSRRPDHWYVGLELAIGLWSLVLGITFPWISHFTSVLMGVEPGPLRHWAIAFVLPFLVLLPATYVQWATSLVPATLCAWIFFLPLPLQFVTIPSGGKLLAYVEGVMAAVSVVGDAGGQVHLKVNNHYQMGGTSSSYSDRRQAHIPLLLHPAPQKALFLGLGTGATFAAAVDHPELEATGVELVPEVAAARSGKAVEKGLS